MKIVRFKAAGKTRYGALEGQHILEYSGTPYSTFKKGRRRWPVKQVVLLTPAVPSKIVCVGLNYRDHAEEMALPIPEEPALFFKPLTALCGPDDPIVYPGLSSRVDYEAELAIVIRKRCRHRPGVRTVERRSPEASVDQHDQRKGLAAQAPGLDVALQVLDVAGDTVAVGSQM